MRRLLQFAACGLIALAGACRADDLTDSAVGAFKAVDPTLQVTVKDADELQIKRTGGEGGAVYLDNLRRTCRADPAGCAEATVAFAKRVAVTFGQDIPASRFSLDALYPTLRHAGYAAQMGKMTKDPAKGLVMRTFSPDIELLFIIDSPNSIRYVTLDEARKAGLADDALLAAAAGNASRLPPLKAIPVPHRDGLFALMFTDSLGSARVFDAALWDRIEADAGGPVAVAVPTRDWILYTRLDDAAHVQDLRVLASSIAAREAYGVSGDVFRRDGAGWKIAGSR